MSVLTSACIEVMRRGSCGEVPAAVRERLETMKVPLHTYSGIKSGYML